jgi:hypothetical protein
VLTICVGTRLTGKECFRMSLQAGMRVEGVEPSKI